MHNIKFLKTIKYFLISFWISIIFSFNFNSILKKPVLSNNYVNLIYASHY